MLLIEYNNTIIPAYKIQERKECDGFISSMGKKNNSIAIHGININITYFIQVPQ